MAIVIPFWILAGILGLWFAKGSFAKRSRPAWAIVGAGIVALAVMPWAMPLSALTPMRWMGGLWVALVAPCLGCLAAGVVLASTPIPRWLAAVVLGVFVLAMTYYAFFVGASAPGSYGP